MNEWTVDLAYLLLTQHDVAAHPDLPAPVREVLEADVLLTAAMYAERAGCAPVEPPQMGLRPALRFWSDLDDVLRHARKTVSDAFADGWLPKDATAPF